MFSEESKALMQQFLDLVNENGGMSQVITIIFNNSYVKTFGPNEVFNMGQVDLEKGLFKFVEEDEEGNAYISYKTAMYVEGVTFAPPGVDKKIVNWRAVRA